MAWIISKQAISAYTKASQNDQPNQAAMDRLWARLDSDPEQEGTPVSRAKSSKDPHLKRVLKALRRLNDMPGSGGVAELDPRVTYEPVEGPSLPPPWLVASVHVPNWPRSGDHTLVAITTVDRHGEPHS